MKFHPSYGLHQGDTISPNLYLICVEGQSVLLKEAQRVKTLHGVKVARGYSPISHLLFADDSLIFYWANLNGWQAIQYMLNHYKQAFGQCINRHKSSIFFSTNTTRATQNTLLQSTMETECTNLEKYLGLLAFVGRAKLASF